METTYILIISLSIVIIIEWIIMLIKTLEIKQFNHLPTYDNPFKEAYFEITNIRLIEYNVAEYTTVVSFFKKSNNKKFVYDKYHFYDRKDKYNIGDKLYLNKK